MAGSVSFSSSLTCQAMFLEPGSGHRALGGPHSMNPGALGGIASTSGVKDPRVLQKGGVKTKVCLKGGTPKYGVSEVWAWRAHCLCTVRLQITCLHMVSLLPDFLTHFPLTPIQVLCSTSSLFLHCSFLSQASDKQVLQGNFCLQENLFPSSSSDECFLFFRSSLLIPSFIKPS